MKIHGRINTGGPILLEISEVDRFLFITELTETGRRDTEREYRMVQYRLAKGFVFSADKTVGSTECEYPTNCPQECRQYRLKKLEDGNRKEESCQNKQRRAKDLK